MEITQDLSRVGQILHIDPGEIRGVIDLVLEGQQTIGVDEDWDAPQAEGLVKADREVSAPTHTNRVIRIEDVVDKVNFGWMMGGFVFCLTRPVTRAGDVIGLDAGLVLKAFQDSGTEGCGLKGRRFPFEAALAILLLLPLKPQLTEERLDGGGAGLPAESDHGDILLGSEFELALAVNLQIILYEAGLGAVVVQPGR